MHKTDRFLLAIVAGVVLLAAVVFAIALLGQDRPAYQPEDTPEGVAHNYLLALQRRDHERAYAYLSPVLRGYPADVGRFTRDVESNGWSFGEYDGDVSLAIEAVNVSGDRATVVVHKTDFYRGGLFDSGQYSTSFDLTLRREDGGWKIVDSDRYWANCWELSYGCK